MLDNLLILSGLKKRWPVVSAEDVLLHNDRDSLWIICGNSVYNITSVLGIHPGGDAALLRRGGGLRDCDEDYQFHSRYARKEWDSCKIAELVPDELAKLPRLASAFGAIKNQGTTTRCTMQGFRDDSTNGQPSSSTSTFTVETVPSTSTTPGHFRVHDAPRTGMGYAPQR